MDKNTSYKLGFSLKEYDKSTNYGLLTITATDNNGKVAFENLSVTAMRAVYDEQKMNEFYKAGLDSEEFKQFCKTNFQIKDDDVYKTFKTKLTEYIKDGARGEPKHTGHSEQRIISHLLNIMEVLKKEELNLKNIEIFTERPCCLKCQLIIMGFKKKYEEEYRRIYNKECKSDIKIKVVDGNVPYNYGLAEPFRQVGVVINEPDEFKQKLQQLFQGNIVEDKDSKTQEIRLVKTGTEQKSDYYDKIGMGEGVKCHDDIKKKFGYDSRKVPVSM